MIDQSGIHPGEVKGNLKAQIMQLLMFAVYHEPIQEARQAAAQLLASLPTTGGVNYIYRFYPRAASGAVARRTPFSAAPPPPPADTPARSDLPPRDRPLKQSTTDHPLLRLLQWLTLGATDLAR